MRLSLGLGPVLGPFGAALLLAAALPLADGSGWLAGVQTAAAQSAPQGRKASSKRPVAKPKSKDAAANTDQQLDAAAKSLAEGNADAAMSTLDGILAGGGLANNHMARALYLRGVAHRKKARPAQAIADLTSAAWLKGGLSDADRTAALKQRAEISREIGVADAGPPPTTAFAAPAPAARQTPTAPVVQAPVAQTDRAPAAQTGPAPAAQTSLIRRPPPVGQPGLTEAGFPRVVDAPARRAAPSRPEPVAQASQAPAVQANVVTRPPAVSAPGPSAGGFTAIVTAAPRRTAPPPRAAPEPRAEPPSRQEPVEQAVQAPTAPTGLIRRPPPVGEAGLTEGGFPRIVATAPPGTLSSPASAASPPPSATGSGDRVLTKSGKATSSWDSATAPPRPDGWVTVEERQKSRAAAPAPGTFPNSGGGIGEFFSGMFGVGPASSPPTEQATRSADAPPWSTSTRGTAPRRVAAKPPEKSVAVVTSAVPPPALATQGSYRLQIAAVRSRPEAEAVAARVRKEHGRVIGARKLEVDETVFGNMGTFYRVRLGPFAAVDESKAMCDQLRTKGYDCLVVTQ